MKKDEKISNYKLKLSSNKKFKEDTFSLSGLQRYAISIFDKKNQNPDFLTLCKNLNLSKDDMRFDHVLKFGKVHELNFIDKSTKEPKEQKTMFSFWLFISCLIRYAESKTVTVPEQIKSVTITEKKKRSSTKKSNAKTDKKDSKAA